MPSTSNWSAKNARDPFGQSLSAEQVLQGVMNDSQDALRVQSVPATGGTSGTAEAIAAVDAAPDRVDTLSYLDAGTADERVSTIVSSSASLGLSYTTTFGYAGSSGSYRVATTTRS